MAVNPKTGFIYDVYTDQPGTNSKTEFVTSTPGSQRFHDRAAVDACHFIGSEWRRQYQLV
jgi:hypothetical protein